MTAHKMVRSYDRQGLEVEFNNDKNNLYPGVQLLTRPGVINPGAHSTTFAFTLFAEDLVHVSQDTLLNEWDVVSDCVQILQDVIAQMNSPKYDDWKVSTSGNFIFYFDSDNDRVAGVKIDFSIDVIYEQDTCAVPSELEIIETISNDYKVYNLTYIADGSEGASIGTDTSPTNVLKGKKIIFVTREYDILYPVSNTPDTTQYVWNNDVFQTGKTINAGERFLFLYRNY